MLWKKPLLQYVCSIFVHAELLLNVTVVKMPCDILGIQESLSVFLSARAQCYASPNPRIAGWIQGLGKALPPMSSAYCSATVPFHFQANLKPGMLWTLGLHPYFLTQISKYHYSRLLFPVPMITLIDVWRI